MKKSLLLGLGAIALSLGGAAIGVSKASAIETKADPVSEGDVIGISQARIWIGYDTTNPFYMYADPSTDDPESSGLGGGIKLWLHKNFSDGDGGEFVYNITGNYTNVAQSSRRYSYFDVDLSVYTNGWYMTVQKFQGGYWKCATNPFQLSSSNAQKIYLTPNDWDWNQTKGDITATAISGDASVDAAFVAKALAGIHTCNNSAVNGYKAYDNFKSTFLGEDNVKVVGSLENYTINDFVKGDTSYSGSTTRVTTAAEKLAYIDEMNKTNGNPSFAANVGAIGFNDNTAIIVIAAVGSGAVVVTSWVFFRRKRKQEK